MWWSLIAQSLSLGFSLPPSAHHGVRIFRRGTAVGMSVAEAAPQHPHLRHGVEGAGRVVALARDVGERGEVDPQIGELPQLCWGPRRGVRRQQAPGHWLQKLIAIRVKGSEQETEASARRAAAESSAKTKRCSLTPRRHQGSSLTCSSRSCLPRTSSPLRGDPSSALSITCRKNHEVRYPPLPFSDMKETGHLLSMVWL